MSFWNRYFDYDGPILGAPLRLLLITFFGIIGSLLCSVLIVQWVVRVEPDQKAETKSRIPEARALRTYSNQLTAMASDFIARVPPEETMPRPSARTWIANAYRDNVYRVFQAIEREPFTSPEFIQLREAVEEMAAMAKNADDAALRRRVLAHAAAATEAAEAFIERHGLSELLLEPRRAPASAG